MTDNDLSEEQRNWVPASEAEAIPCWPYCHKAEAYGGELVFLPGWDEPWDWRSVALAARAYPGWTVTLEDEGPLLVRPPERQPGEPAV
jgi:hypothetical protein